MEQQSLTPLASIIAILKVLNSIKVEEAHLLHKYYSTIVYIKLMGENKIKKKIVCVDLRSENVCIVYLLD